MFTYDGLSREHLIEQLDAERSTHAAIKVDLGAAMSEQLATTCKELKDIKTARHAAEKNFKPTKAALETADEDLKTAERRLDKAQRDNESCALRMIRPSSREHKTYG